MTAALPVRPSLLLSLSRIAAACAGALLLAAGGGSHAADHAPPKPAAKSTVKAAAESPAAKADEAQNLDQLRQRLAEKLGATKAPDARSPNLLRVSTRADAPVPAPAPPHAPAPSAAPRKPSAAVMAALDTHRADKPTAAAALAAPAHAGQAGASHWAYGGETGPAAWGGLKPEFATCAKGQRQSPIDIRGGIAVDLDPVQFDYRASAFGVIDNGHTVQVNLAPGNSIQIGGRRYELVQFHFHRPSEERIDGRQFDMSLHLVHKDAEGRLAVIGLLLERGAPQPVVQRVWNALPLEKGEEQPATTVLDLEHLLPPDRGYYTYMGSLTTPPCSEGVLWMVMRQPVTLSPAQIDIFARLYPMNARPIQSASGRLIKQSQ